MNDLWRKALQEGEQQGARYTITPPVIASDGLVGTQLANRAGSSIEFMDHRDYQPGDDIRRIDWSAYARSDRLAVRLFREEVCPHLDLVIDGSRSMDLVNSQKAAATLGLAAAWSTAADNSKFTHQTYLAAEHIEPIAHGNDRPAAWEGLDFNHDGNLSDAIAIHPRLPRFRRQAVRVLISDLLWMGEPLPLLTRLSEGAASMVVVQMLSEADVNPPQRGNVRLVDSETGLVQDVFVDAATQQRYRDKLQRHQDAWQTACRQIGALMVTMVGETLLENWDLSGLVQHEVLRV